MEVQTMYKVNNLKGDIMAGLTIAKVAEWLSVPRSTVLYWVNNGEFPNAGKKNPYAKTSPFEIPVEDVEKFLAKLGEDVPPYPKSEIANGGNA